MAKAKRQKRLPPKVKTAIVRALAEFNSPSAVVEIVNAELGLQISRQVVQRYNPETRTGATLSGELRTLFDKHREAFRRDLESVPISSMALRLRRLDRLALRAEAAGDFETAVKAIMVAARDIGGTYAGKFAAKIEHTHRPNRPPLDLKGKTTEELAEMWRQEVRKLDEDSEAWH